MPWFLIPCCNGDKNERRLEELEYADEDIWYTDVPPEPFDTTRFNNDAHLVYNTLLLVSPYLDTLDILRCSKVCKLWETVCRSLPWYMISMNGKDVDFPWIADEIHGLVRRNEIRKLIIRNFPLEMMNEKILNHDFTFRNVRKLIVEDSSLAVTYFLISMCPNLEFAMIRLLPTTSAGNILDFDIFQKTPKLVQLFIYCHRGLRMSNNTKLPKLTRLYLLQLDSIYIDDEDADEDLDWENFSQLEVLALGYMDSICDNVTSISPLVNLRVLILDRYSYVDDNLFYHMQQLDNLTTLMFLEVYSNMEFMMNLLDLTNIKKLILVSRYHKYLLPKFNQEILAAIMSFKHLREFIWGFAPKTVDHICKNNGGLRRSFYLATNEYNEDYPLSFYDFSYVTEIIKGKLKNTKAEVKELDCSYLLGYSTR